MQKVFNMGCGFVAIVPDAAADAAIAQLSAAIPAPRASAASPPTPAA